MIDIIGKIKQLAEQKGYLPVVASPRSVNYELGLLDLSGGAQFMYITLPTITRGKEGQFYNNELTFRLELMLGRKAEPDTQSSIQEREGEKYDNRLYEMARLMNEFISDLLDCSNEMEEMAQTQLVMYKNVFSISVDAVMTTLTIRAWNQ